MPSIRQHGGLYSLRELQARQIENVIFASNLDSRSIDKRYALDDYVRLCFADSHPMHHVARKEGRILESVFLRIDPSVMEWEGVRVADGIAYGRDVHLLDPEEALERLDFEVLTTYMKWKDPEIKARLFKARKYELLVPHHIPLEFIGGL